MNELEIQVMSNTGYHTTMTNNYIFKSATELSRLIRNKEATSTAVLKAHLDQIRKHNPAIGAIVVLLEEQPVIGKLKLISLEALFMAFR